MRKTPRQQRSAFTVEVIVEAATRLLGREGRSLTTNRIAELAGVSIGSIYQYFGTKQAILNEVARRHLVNGEQALMAVFERKPVATHSWQEVLEDLVVVAVSENRTHGSAHGRLRYLVTSLELSAQFEQCLDRVADRFSVYLVKDGWHSDQALDAARLVFASVDAQVHLLARDLERTDESISSRVTQMAVRALGG